MTISTTDQLIEAMAGARRLPLVKHIESGRSNSGLYSTWALPGTPCVGTEPTSAATCSRTSVGAVPLPAPDSGKTWHLLSAAPIGRPFQIPILVFDRLAHVGSLSTTSTSAQSFSLTLPARCTVYEEVSLYVEVYAVGGASAPTVTVSYTNQSGTSGRTGTISFSAGINALGQLSPPMVKQSGDTGIQSVQSIQLSGSSGASGTWGVTLMRGPYANSGGRTAGPIDGSILPVDLGEDPCLMTVLAGTPSTANMSYPMALVLGQG